MFSNNVAMCCDEETVSKVKDFLDQDNYDEAIKCFKEVLNKWKQSKVAFFIGLSYCCIGEVCFRKKEYTEAIKYYNKALQLWEFSLGKSHFCIPLSGYYMLGNIYCATRDFNQAIENYKKALSLHKTEDLDKSVIYGKLGDAYFGDGKYAEAIVVCKEALEICKTIQREGGNSSNFLRDNLEEYVIELYQSLGHTLHVQENYNEAIIYYNEALNIQRTDGICNNLGEAYRAKEDYVQAIKQHKEALQIGKGSLGREHQKVGTYYNNLAGDYLYFEDYDSAIKYYNKALTIKVKTLGEEHLETCAIYNNLGLIYHEMGDYKRALKYYNKTIKKISEEGIKEEGRSSVVGPYVARVYKNLGMVYSSKKNYQLAIDNFNTALVISERKLGKQHADTALIYSELAKGYCAKKEYDSAIKNCKEELEIWKAKFGEQHANVAECYNRLGSFYKEQGKYDRAIGCHIQAIQHHPKEAKHYLFCGLVYKAKGEAEKVNADQNFKKALFLAVENDDLDTIKKLYQNGISLNYKDDEQNKNTALHLSARHDRVAILCYLLERDEIDVNATNGRGQNALHIAICYDRQVGVALLIMAGADASAKDFRRKKPFEYVKNSHQKTAIKTLMQGNAPKSIHEILANGTQYSIFGEEEAKQEAKKKMRKVYKTLSAVKTWKNKYQDDDMRKYVRPIMKATAYMLKKNEKKQLKKQLIEIIIDPNRCSVDVVDELNDKKGIVGKFSYDKYISRIHIGAKGLSDTLYLKTVGNGDALPKEDSISEIYIPLLVKRDEKIYIYGEKLDGSLGYSELSAQLYNGIAFPDIAEENPVKLQRGAVARQIWQQIWEEIIAKNAHTLEKPVQGTTAHEFCHNVALYVFENEANPYRSNDCINKEWFTKICDELLQSKNILDPILKRVFTLYNPKHYHLELIVRVPQMIAQYGGKVALEKLETQAPELLSYYEKVFLPACKKYYRLFSQKSKIIKWAGQEEESDDMPSSIRELRKLVKKTSITDQRLLSNSRHSIFGHQTSNSTQHQQETTEESLGEQLNL